MALRKTKVIIIQNIIKLAGCILFIMFWKIDAMRFFVVVGNMPGKGVSKWLFHFKRQPVFSKFQII